MHHPILGQAPYGVSPTGETVGDTPDAARMCILGAMGVLGLIVLPLLWR